VIRELNFDQEREIFKFEDLKGQSKYDLDWGNSPEKPIMKQFQGYLDYFERKLFSYHRVHYYPVKMSGIHRGLSSVDF